MLGRSEMDQVGSGVDAGEVYANCIAPFRANAQADPQGFVADLRVAVTGDTGGFVTYGASCLVVELLGYDLRTEDALALLDEGVAFKHERDLPSASLKGYEWKRWLEVHGPGTW
jgi:hypothetical protein